jgi:hypothetical protein
VRFRKKPVVIEAVQLDGTKDGCRRVHDFLGWEHNDAGNCPGPISIETLEGEMMCELGSWVVKGIQGEFYPVKPDIFAMTYEPVPSGPREGACFHDWIMVDGLRDSVCAKCGLGRPVTPPLAPKCGECRYCSGTGIHRCNEAGCHQEGEECIACDGSGTYTVLGADGIERTFKKEEP